MWEYCKAVETAMSGRVSASQNGAAACKSVATITAIVEDMVVMSDGHMRLVVDALDDVVAVYGVDSPFVSEARRAVA